MGGHQRRCADFVIIGAMKAGSTTLFDWLGQHPDVKLPAVKEPEYFLRGSCPTDYATLFPARSENTISGEASVAYADARWAVDVAARIAATAPDARLIYLVRDPVERVRSHYHHECLRGRETRPIREAVRDDPSYEARSDYASVYDAFAEAGLDLQVFVFEELVRGGDEELWRALLAGLGLSYRTRDRAASNTSKGKPRFRAGIGALYRSERIRRALFAVVKRIPKSVRRWIRPFVLDDAKETAERLMRARDGELPDVVIRRIQEQRVKMQERLGRPLDRWL